MLSDESARVTIVEVAEYAGVSTATVSRVVNKTGQVSKTTAAKVQSAIEALNYKPNAAARGLASHKTNAIGLVLDDIEGEFFMPMLRGVEMAARENGFELLIHSTGGPGGGGGRRRAYALGEHNTDGLVVFASSLPQEELARLHHLGFPLVLLHRSSPPALKIPCVTIENKYGAHRLMNYLIEERGYRRIAFLAGPDSHEDSYWRKLGYQEALAAHGIPYDPHLVFHGGFSEHQSRLAVASWLERGLDAEALFAADDDSAIGALYAIKESGRRVPQDIAVVGFDDIRLASYLDPPLTTVRAPTEQAARVAVEQLARLIQGGEAEVMTLLPTELVIRRSCGYRP
jgi:DNA-binding LacI/PurR family transcriptional regulator